MGTCSTPTHFFFFFLLRHSEIPAKAIFEAHFLILGKRKFDSYMIMIQIVHIFFRLDSQNCFLPVFHGKQNLNSLDNHLEI